MKKRIVAMFLIAAVLAAVLATKALTQMGSSNEVSIAEAGSQQPGQMFVGGNYTIGSGYTFSSITVDVRPTGGGAGEGGEAVATVEGGGTFTATVSVPSGTYDVQAYLTVTDSSGTPYYFFSNTPTGVPVQ